MKASTLRIHLLGPMEIRRGEEDLSLFPTQKSQILFSFLALHHKKLHSRELLASVFWPGGNSTAGRKRLRTELWLTRKFLEPKTGEQLLQASNQCLGLNPRADIWIDVVELESILSPFLCAASDSPTPEARDRLARAADLYRGDLLEGRYEEWCLEARECFRARFLTALERLATHEQKHGRWREAVACSRKILQLDPLRESAHRILMLGLFELGDRAGALRQFERCAGLLAAELDVEPMYETACLYQQIKAFRGPVAAGNLSTLPWIPPHQQAPTTGSPRQ